MNLQKNIFLALIALCIFAASCQQSATLADDAAVNIPATTSSVTSFNMKNLMDKADFPAIQKMAFYQDMIQEASQGNPGIVAVLNDPEASGIDLDANVYMTQDINVMNPENAFTAVLASLKDKEAFEKLVTAKGSPAVKSGDGFQYFQPNGNTIVSWNDQITVMGMSQNRRADLKESVSKMFATTPETSVATNDDLKKCFAKKADVISWFSSDAMADMDKGDMGMAMAAAGFSSEMMKDNYAHSYLNFEKGEIESESQYSINDKISAEFKHLLKDEVDTDFSKYLPAENLMFAFSGALDMRGIKMILDKKGMSGMADYQIKEFGLSTEGLSKTFDGDFMVSGYGVEGQKNPSILLVTKINDKENFQKILDLGMEYRMLTEAGNGVYNIRGAIDRRLGKQPQIMMSGDMVFIGDATNSISAIQSGDWMKKSMVGKEVKNVVTDNVMGAFVNFATMGDFMGKGTDWSGMEDGFLRMDRDDASLKIEMKDKKSNSLKSLFEMLNRAYEKNEMGRMGM